MIKKNQTKLFAMPNCQKLGLKISKNIDLPLSKYEHTKFADGESLFVSKETVRNKNVFIVASSSTPVNENIIQLLIFVDSLKRASAKSITVILAYYGYSRQDRKIMGRQPIAAKLIADLLEKSGVTKLISCDLHNPSIQGFFNIPVDDLKGQYILAPSIKKIGKFTIASPDHGGAVRARILSEILSDSIEIAIVDKRRTKPNQTETMGILGDVKNKNIVILDDIIDTGQTIIKATHALKKVGAKNIVVAASHGIFTKGFNLFEDCKYIDKVLITDSIEHVYELEKKHKKLKVVSIAKMIALTIEAIINSKSISIIYEKMFNKINKT